MWMPVLNELDTGKYRFIEIEGVGKRLMRWETNGKLCLVTDQQFYDDMWSQWNQWSQRRFEAKVHNDDLKAQWGLWKERKKTHVWYDNPKPDGEYIRFEHPNAAYERVMVDSSNSIMDFGETRMDWKVKRESTLYVENGRFTDQRKPVGMEKVRFSFGTGDLTPSELKWVRDQSVNISSGRALTSFKAILLGDDNVLAWEVTKKFQDGSRLDSIIDSGRRLWDVIVTVIISGKHACDSRCRGAKGKDCNCVCLGKFHGAKDGLAPNEVRINDTVIIGTEYSQVIRDYDKL